MSVLYRPAPCVTCPFRRSTKKGLWHKSEFEGLQARESTLVGAEFGCHEDATKESKERGPCIGWLTDQYNHNVPSFALRLRLMRDKKALEHFNSLDFDALEKELYSSVEEMCRENKKADDKLRRRAAREGYEIVGKNKLDKKGKRA